MNSCGWNTGKEVMHLTTYALTSVHNITYNLMINTSND